MALLVAAFSPLCNQCAPADPHGDKSVAPPLEQSKGQMPFPIEKLARLTNLETLKTLSGDHLKAHLFITCYWISQASMAKIAPAESLKRARLHNGAGESAITMETGDALVRAFGKLDALGCLSSPGLERLKAGRAPLITVGPHVGASVAVGHLIPPSRVRELEDQLFNLEIRAESGHTAAPPERQLEYARRWHWQGLLSDQGYAAIVYAFPSRGAGK